MPDGLEHYVSIDAVSSGFFFFFFAEVVTGGRIWNRAIAYIRVCLKKSCSEEVFFIDGSKYVRLPRSARSARASIDVCRIRGQHPCDADQW